MCSPKKEFGKGRNDPEHNIGGIEGSEEASKQHDALKKVISNFGAEIFDAAEMPGHPNSVFTRDMATSTPEGVIKAQLGLPTRVGEEVWMAERVGAISEPFAGEITLPGTLEGGDVVLAGDVAFIGDSVRTNAIGIQQFINLMKPMGYQVRVIKLPETVLHLDKALMTLGGRKLLYCEDLVTQDDISGFEGINITSGENATANIICLGDNELVVNSSNSVAQEKLKDEGFHVHSLDLSEFAKGMGGPNCLIMPIERVAD